MIPRLHGISITYYISVCLNMQTLRLFADVARCHSFSQAAEMHGISQSAASQRIGQLEKKLGVTLLDRSVRPLELTPAGKLFAEGCEEVVGRYDHLESKVAGLGKKPEGVVRVMAIYSAGIDLLCRVREQFEAEHEKISVEIRYERPDQVYRAVLEKECDMGIVSYPERWRKMDSISLRDEEMVVVCNTHHKIAEMQSISVSDLEGNEMVTFDTDLPVGRQIREYFKSNGVKPTISNVFDNIDTIKGALAVTEQLSILPRRTVIREVEAGTLAMVTMTPRLLRPLGVIFRRSARNGSAFSPAAKAFADFLAAHAGSDAAHDGQALQEGHTLMEAGK
jgi:DNA-binding transcriptional LysR family regulator